MGDSDKRSNYDRFGVDSESTSAQQNPFQSFQGFGNGQRFQGEVSPEDLLNMFMGGAMGGNGFRFQTGGFRSRRNQRTSNNEPETILQTILQFLPVALILFLSLFSVFASESDPFSFRRSYEYSLAKSTGKHHVNYYVNPSTFDRRFGTSRKLARLESQVEEDVLFLLILVPASSSG